jgi:hypothetical protein
MARLRRINTKERRASRRIPASKVIPHGIARLNTGHEVGLVNIGLNGTILVNTKIMMPPGSCVRLRLKISKTLINLDGRIQRSRVVGLKQAKILYEAAMILDGGLPQPLANLLQRRDEANPQAEQSSSRDFHPEAMTLPDTAQLWILNAPGVAAEA